MSRSHFHGLKDVLATEVLLYNLLKAIFFFFFFFFFFFRFVTTTEDKQWQCSRGNEVCNKQGFNSKGKYTERKKKRRVEFFPSYFNHFFTVFTIAIHFYRLSCECEPRVYESLVDVLSNQCVKSFNRALHSALHGQ